MTNSTDKKRIALIDGYGFVFRAYFSLPPLTRNDGTPVGAVYGFTNMLIKLLAGLNVTHAAVIFDSGSKTFRNEIYKDYKANRPPCPEDLKPQFPIIREAAESFNLMSLEKIGFEADDIIATVAHKLEKEDFEVLVVSSDKDLMQLVNDNISMYDAMKNRMITAKEVEEKFMVAPDKVIDILSLMGDSSDNVPGVKGIGPKTAAELIQEFGSLEGIFENLDKIKQNKRREYLTNGVESAKLSKTLVTLRDDVELGITAEDLEVKAIDPHKLLSFLEYQGFRSLENRVKKEFGISGSAGNADGKTNSQPDSGAELLATINQEFGIAGTAEQQLGNKNTNQNTNNSLNFSEIKKTAITEESTFQKIEEQAVKNGTVTIDYHSENNELQLVTISTNKVNSSPEEIFYFEVENSGNTKPQISNTNEDLFSFGETTKTEEKGNKFSLNHLEKILQNDSIKKIFFNAKPFLKLTETNSYEDLSLINHLLNSAVKHNLRELIEVNINEDVESLGLNEVFTGLEKKSCDEIFAREEIKASKLDFFAFRNFAISELYRFLAPRIFELKLSEAYQSYELPTIQAIADMEGEGIKINVQKLHELSENFGNEINKLTKEIHDLAGEEFNIASPKQLGEILFNKLGLESSKKSKKTGALSTGHAVLEELAEEGNIIADKVLEFRKFSKLKNTYTDALPQEINPKTGRIHSHFSTISTITGRFSSTNPNLQNIPIRTAEGRKIRECFIADKGNMLISADYSQVELRVIAQMAKIDALKEAFKQDKDIHRITASQVFEIAENEVSDDLRSKAKAINFGIIYGISAFGLAKQLDISRSDAAKYIESYLHAYPGIDDYMKTTIDFARKHGFVQTLSGRKCFINSINDKNPIARSEAERLSINAPIQGGAADIIKKAMVKLNREFKRQNLPAKILLQIHDELIIETPKDQSEKIGKLVKSVMENAVQIEVPLKVDVEIKENWE